MIVKFDQTGTHKQHGSGAFRQEDFLKVGFNVYPELGDKTYPIHNVKVAGKWRVNPCLKHFIRIPPPITALELSNYIKQIFDGNLITQLDYLLSDPTPANRSALNILMNARTGFNVKAGVVDFGVINNRFASLQPISISKSGVVKDLPSGTITIGAREGASSSSSMTVVNKVLAADGTGTITTAYTKGSTDRNGTNDFATFTASGNNLTTRDSEQNVGTIVGGSEQTTTGLTVDVVLYDYFGHYYSAGYLYYGASVGKAFWYVNTTDLIPCTAQAFSFLDNYAAWVGGVGTEAAGVTFVPRVMFF